MQRSLPWSPISCLFCYTIAMLDSPSNLPDEPDELRKLVGTLAFEVKS